MTEHSTDSLIDQTSSPAARRTRLRASLGDLPDHMLVQRAQRNDAHAFEALMRRYNRRLFRIARGILRDDATAEDAVQEAYIQVFTHLDRYRPTGKFSAWLTRVAVNEALMLRRKTRADHVSLEDLDGPALEAQDLSREEGGATPDAVEVLQARQLLERAIDRLPEAFRVVFMLRMVEQLSVSETATALGINEATVRTRLHRAQRLLRTDLMNLLCREQLSVFDFGGARCDRIVDRVLARLRLPPYEEPQP